MPEVDPPRGGHVTGTREDCLHISSPSFPGSIFLSLKKKACREQFPGNGEMLREKSCRDTEKKTSESQKCGNAGMICR